MQPCRLVKRQMPDANISAHLDIQTRQACFVTIKARPIQLEERETTNMQRDTSGPGAVGEVGCLLVLDCQTCWRSDDITSSMFRPHRYPSNSTSMVSRIPLYGTRSELLNILGWTAEDIFIKAYTAD